MKASRFSLVEKLTFFIVFISPILYLGNKIYLSYSTSKTFLIYGLIELVFLLWLVSLLKNKSFSFTKKDFVRMSPIFVYVFVLSLASVFGENFNMSFWSSFERGTGLLSILHFTAFGVVLYSLVKKHGSDFLNKLFLYFIFGSFVLNISIWLGSEGFNLPINFLEKSQGGGLMGNSSLSATIILISFFINIFLLFGKNLNKKIKAFLYFNIIFIIVSPVFINIFGESFFVSARGAFYSLLLGALLVPVFKLYFSENKNKKYLGLFFIISGFVILISSSFLVTKNGNFLNTKFKDLVGENRVIFWNTAVGVFKESPLLGYGPENYYLANQRYFNSALWGSTENTVEVWNDRAHNVVFDHIINSGVLGLISYLVVLLSVFYFLNIACRNNTLSKLEASILASMFFAYFTQNLFVFDSYVSLLWFFSLVSGVYALSFEDSKDEKLDRLKIKSVFLALILLLPLVIFFAVRPYKKAYNLSHIMSLSVNKRADSYGDLLKGSYIGNTKDVAFISDDFYSIYDKNKDVIKNDSKIDYFKKDILNYLNYLETISEKEKDNYHLFLNITKIYNLYISLGGDIDPLIKEKSIKMGQRSVELCPNDPQGYWALSIAYFRSGDKKSAIEAVNKAIEVAPNITFSRDLLEVFSK